MTYWIIKQTSARAAYVTVLRKSKCKRIYSIMENCQLISEMNNGTRTTRLNPVKLVRLCVFVCICVCFFS